MTVLVTIQARTWRARILMAWRMLLGKETLVMGEMGEMYDTKPARLTDRQRGEN